MCDPLSLSIASTVAGVAGTAANTMGQMGAQKKQAAEVHNWQQEQKKFRDMEQVRQEQFRQNAEKQRAAGVQKISGEDQAKRQEAEEARLNAYLQEDGSMDVTQETGGAPVSVADKSLTGQSGGDPVFKTDLAKKISESLKGAKERIGNLATVASFGQSFGGLGTTNPLLQQATGQDIDRWNEVRRGSLGAFSTERAIEPVQVTYTPSPLGDMFSSALSFGAQGLGSSFAGGAGTGFPGPNTSASSFIGPARALPKKYAATKGLF